MVARKGKVNYEVDVGEGRKYLKIYYINMLLLWLEPVVHNLLDEEEEEAETKSQLMKKMRKMRIYVWERS